MGLLVNDDGTTELLDEDCVVEAFALIPGRDLRCLGVARKFA